MANKMDERTAFLVGRQGTALMFLYLSHGPRVLYLLTSPHDERLGRPRRALVFRAGDSPTQAVVEFLPKDEIDLTNTIRLTNRVIKGCLGLISVEGGAFVTMYRHTHQRSITPRYISSADHKCN